MVPNLYAHQWVPASQSFHIYSVISKFLLMWYVKKWFFCFNIHLISSEAKHLFIFEWAQCFYGLMDGLPAPIFLIS